jgi:hypothetical protein
MLEVLNGAALQGVVPIMQASIQAGRARRLRKMRLLRHRSAQMSGGNASDLAKSLQSEVKIVRGL